MKWLWPCLMAAAASASPGALRAVDGSVRPRLHRRLHRSADSPREAVLVHMPSLDELCHAQTLLALVKSSSSPDGPHRDVWYIHDPEYPPSDDGPLMTELQRAGLKTEACNLYPRTDCWLQFAEENMAGNTKGCSLMFARSHSEYDRFWMVEEDSLFAGKWHTYFDSVHENDADVIGELNTAAWRDAVTYGTPALEVINCKANGGFCWTPDGNTTRVVWFLMRASHRFLARLADSIDKDETCAHHEVSSVFCDVSDWCSLSNLPLELKGYLMPGHYGEFLTTESATWDKMVEVAELQPTMIAQKAYHPVKCAADSLKGHLALAYAEASC